MARIPLEPGPDAGIYDPETRIFYIGNGGRKGKQPYSFITLVSAADSKVVGRIRVESNNLEAMSIDHTKHLLFVNMRDKGQIGVVDLEKNEVRQVWSIPGLNLNTPMQLDAENHRLFVAGRKPGKLSVIDTENGQLVTTMDCIETADDMIFDTTDRRIYVSGSGGLTIIQQQGPDSYKALEQFPTNAGKTVGALPEARSALRNSYENARGQCRASGVQGEPMRSVIALAALLAFSAYYANAQNHAADLPTSNLLRGPGPTFTVPESDLKSPVTFIAYGDMRFTDPKNTTATNPAVRKWLVNKLASERPTAIFLNGDVPLAGDVVNDYQVYASESQPWRASGIHVYPALGNHEFHGPNPQQCLENWWNAFPEFRNRRWYSVQLGARIYAINLDSDASLLPALTKIAG